ncbi:MAG: bifunctional hydroxymethylpyrimidine kinase/phosphomethylpyrimidine kinase [Candidatus Micrarchaeota archaeon]
MAVLSIAGSSPDGAAGVQMDLKVFDALGTMGTSVITALTSQNTKETKGMWWVPPEIILSQLRSVFSDVDIKAVKIGMIGHPEVARTVYEYLKRKKVSVVFDPVMSAQSDKRSLFEAGALPYIRKLISISDVVTPNTDEAETITGMEVSTISGAEEAAERIQKMGAKAVLITGIRTGVISDVFKYDFKFTYTKQIKVGGTKGGGCCLSSAIAAFMSQGISIPSSVEHAEGFVDAAISYKRKIGHGIHSLDPLSTLRKDADRYSVLCNTKAALTMLETHNEFTPFIPEIGTNIVCAISSAQTIHEVAGVVGRIRDAMGIPKSLGIVEFGASSHMARAVITAMSINPERCSAVNMAVVPKLDSACRKAGFSIGRFDRRYEPKGKRKSGSMEWGILHAAKKGKVPDVVFDSGSIGKEPSAFVFGHDAIDAVTKSLKIAATSLRNSAKYR